MKLKTKIDRLRAKVQPLIVPMIVLSIFTSGTLLWKVQQDNVDSLQGKIEHLQKKISNNLSKKEKLKIEERLKLEKDLLIIEKDTTTIQNSIYATLVQAIGGVILSITAYVGYKNFKIGEDNLKIGQKNLKVAEDKQVTERFSKSIEHLGSDKIDIRLGGIYALEQIAIDSPKYHWTIVEIINAFIREKRPLDSVGRVSVDIQAALSVLGRRKASQDPVGKNIDLRKVNLEGIEIPTANLQGANLQGANLQGANLQGVNLRHVDFGEDPSLYDPFLFKNPLDNLGITKVDLRDADLSTCENLTHNQLSNAITNENTQLPNYLK
jgi:hypothetical protein